MVTNVVYDFHAHSSFSDGELSPMELVRRALVQGYRAIAVTDHVSLGELSRVIPETVEICAFARSHWDILAIPGIELTHTPPGAIAEAARRAKDLGAWIVVVHGETIVEPVEEGTNLAALYSPDVDILAHPGLITPDEANIAAASGIFLEISARAGHCLTNGYVASIARKHGARLLVDSDAHRVKDLLTASLAAAICRGAGLESEVCRQTLTENPQALIKKLPGANPSSHHETGG